ncbi:MAG: hypothetical protein ACYCT1_08170 [Steroidobacteraceae bacterium]
MAEGDKAVIVKVLLPQELLVEVDELAAAWGSPRATVLRILVVEQLRTRGSGAAPAAALANQARAGLGRRGRPRKTPIT